MPPKGFVTASNRFVVIVGGADVGSLSAAWAMRATPGARRASRLGSPAEAGLVKRAEEGQQTV